MDSHAVTLFAHRSCRVRNAEARSSTLLCSTQRIYDLRREQSRRFRFRCEHVDGRAEIESEYRIKFHGQSYKLWSLPYFNDRKHPEIPLRSRQIGLILWVASTIASSYLFDDSP
jgi:hypothetical protein